MSITDEDITTAWRSCTELPVADSWTWYGSDEVYAAGDAALRRCVGDPQAFLADHWEQGPALGPGDGHFRDLLDLAGLDELLSCRELRHPDVRMLFEQEFLQPQMLISRGFHPVVDTDPIDPARIFHHLNEGATLVMQNADVLWPALRRFCDEMAVRLSHRTSAAVFFSTAHPRGGARHLDRYENFALQIHGSKRWIVEEPRGELPMSRKNHLVGLPPGRVSQYNRANSMPPSRVVLDTVLVPGQSLYIPRGFIHSVSNESEESLHVAIAVDSTTSSWALGNELSHAATQHPTLRSGLPPGFALPAGGTNSASFGEMVAGLRFDPQSLLDAEVERFWTERKAPAAGRVAQLISSDAIDATSLVHRVPGLVVRTQAHGDRMYLRVDDRELSFPLAANDWVRRILKGPEVTVGRIGPTSRLDEVLIVVRRLVREGVVKAVGPANGHLGPTCEAPDHPPV
jgi:lysine-specific demethylase/histidyl-hydroxylase NO66